jgi:hypothetical protein
VTGLRPRLASLALVDDRGEDLDPVADELAVAAVVTAAISTQREAVAAPAPLPQRPYEGPRTQRQYEFAARDVARALVVVGRGQSY